MATNAGRAASHPIFQFVVRDIAVMAACVVFGLPAAHAIGLGLPLIDRLLARDFTVQPDQASALVSAVVFGGGIGLLSGLSVMLFSLVSWNRANVRLIFRPLHDAFVDALHAALTEEIVSRLGAFAILWWLISWGAKASGHPLPNAGVWVVVVIVAVSNAILGAAGAGMIITSGRSVSDRGVATLGYLTIIFVITLAGNVGFGYFFWRFGLETAALSHLTMAVVQNLISIQWLGTRPDDAGALSEVAVVPQPRAGHLGALIEPSG